MHCYIYIYIFTKHDTCTYRVSQKKTLHLHNGLSFSHGMTDIGRITFPASFNTIFVKRNFTVDFTVKLQGQN